MAAVASLIRIVCGLFALVLATQIVFTLFQANPNKWITRAVTDWSSNLSLGLNNLFTPNDPILAVVANYGIPAIAWLVIGAVLTGILRATLGRATRRPSR